MHQNRTEQTHIYVICNLAMLYCFLNLSDPVVWLSFSGIFGDSTKQAAMMSILILMDWILCIESVACHLGLELEVVDLDS